MPGLRQESEAYILHWIERIAPGSQNKKLYQDKFAAMSDEEYDKMIEGIEKDQVYLAVIAPNFSDARLTVQNNFEVADELGHNFFQRVLVPARNGMPAYRTPIPYLIMDLPVRRQAQLLEKKISIPENNNAVDDLTGQPTGPSKGSKISYPETQVLAAMGLEQCLLEFLKYRGGDEKGFNAMNTMIARTGGVSMKAIAPFAGGVKATTTLKNYLMGMHLRPTGLH
jgi:hypothetical protein